MTLEAARSATATATIYDLDPAQFLRDDSLTIVGFDWNPERDLEVRFRQAHPFPAPDFSQPASGTNRADLGYTGRLLILADEESQSFFSNSVTLDPGTIKHADGYLKPGPLLATTGLTNNTFPFVLLADEGEDNRVGVSNGGSLSGNYNPATGGWTRANANLTANGLGWTGFDYIHQGQAIENTFTLAADRLDDGPLTLQLALVVTYTEPKGGASGTERRAHRLPGVAPDITEFAYRLPYSALDVSRVGVPLPTHLIDIPGAFADLEFQVRDWDVLGTEGLDTDVSDEPLLDTIPDGSRATPIAVIDAPDLMTAPPDAGYRNYGSGLPSAELPYQLKVENELDPGPGTYLSLLRVTDPEWDNDDSAYHLGLDPTTLKPPDPPAPSIAIREIFQVVPITVLPLLADDPLAPPIILSVPEIDDGYPTAVQPWTSGVFAANNPTGWLWDFGDGATALVPAAPIPTVVYGSEVGIFYGSVTASNANGTSQPKYFSYVVEDLPTPVDPYAPTLRTVTVAGPAFPVLSGDGQLVLRVTEYSSPLPGTVTIQFDWNNDGDFADVGEAMQPLTGTPPISFTSPLAYDNNTLTTRVGQVPFRYLFSSVGTTEEKSVSWALGPNQPPVITGQPGITPSFQPSPAVFTITPGNATAIDPEGDPITFVVTNTLNGDLSTSLSLPMPSNTTPFVEFASTDVTFTVRATDATHTGGNAPDYPPVEARVDPPRARRYGDDAFAEGSSLAVAGDGSVYMCGRFSGVADFGGGPRTSGVDIGGYVVKFDSLGNWVWDRVYQSTLAAGNHANTVHVGTAGELFVGGEFASPTNFGGGARTPAGLLTRDAFVLRLDSDGQYIWDIAWGGPGEDRALDLDAFPNGDILVGGQYVDAATSFGGPPEPSGGGGDGVVVRYTNAGAWVWNRTIRGTSLDSVYGLTVDGSCCVYACGVFSTGFNFGGGPKTGQGGGDIFLLKLDQAGLYQWDFVRGTALFDDAQTVVVAPDGDPVIAGIFGAALDFGGGLRPNAGFDDIYIARYDSLAGAHLWDRTYGSAIADNEGAVSRDPAGNLYFNGRFGGTIDFGGGSRTSNGLQDAVVVKFTENGGYLWDATWGGLSTDTAERTVVDPVNGWLYASGLFDGTVDFDPSLGGIYNLTATGTDAFINRLDASTGLW